MSVNHFGFSQLWRIRKTIPVSDGDAIRTTVWIQEYWRPDRRQNLIICSLANLPWKFRANPFWSFYAKLLTNRQTNKQTNKRTNNDDYMSSLAEFNSSSRSSDRCVQCVCLSTSGQQHYFERNDLWPRYFACWLIMTKSRSTSKLMSYVNVRDRYTWLHLLCLTPPAEGFPWDISVKFSVNVNGGQGT